MFNLKLTSEYKLLDTLDVVVDDDGKLGHERFFFKKLGLVLARFYKI